MNGRLIAIVGLVAALVATGMNPAAAEGRTLIVGPGGYSTIQAAVDDAEQGDTVHVMPGVYQEAVIVTVPHITIRGESRESVILEGGGVLDNAFSVAVDGVTLRSMTAKNYDSNGFAFSGVDGFFMYDLHSIDARVYGLYAIHSVNGEIAYSIGEGSGDGGFYIGETPHCNCDVHHNVMRGNSIGYSGTANSYVRIWENEIYDNRAGIVMSVLPNEAGVEDDGTIYGTQVRSEIYDNYVHHNNNKDAPRAGFTETVNIPVGVGIQIGGGWFNDVHDNLVVDNDFAGIMIHWLFTPPRGNFVHDNTIEGGRYGIWWDEWGEDHCFNGNVVTGAEKVSDPDPLPTCPGPVGDLPCPAEVYDWFACRANHVSVVDPLKEAELAWRVATDADADDDLYPEPL